MKRHATLIHERVSQCHDGTNEKMICRVSSGWVVMGDTQFLPGYCLLLADPVVASLNTLSAGQRKTYLYEMSVLGDVLLEVTGARLINYEILGNLETALHAHLFPRYHDEPNDQIHCPVWMYDKKYRNSPSVSFDPERDQALMDQVREGLISKGIAIENP